MPNPQKISTITPSPRPYNPNQPIPMEHAEQKVFLLVGPRASGKTSYAQRIIEKQPQIELVSRDAILEEHFGGVHQSPYTGAHYVALRMMFEELFRQLSNPSAHVLLECWTGGSLDRRAVIGRIKEFNARIQIIALYFKTPFELVGTWFWNKPRIAKISEIREKADQGYSFYRPASVQSDYTLFHEFATTISTDGFNQIIVIEDPREEVITL